MQDLQGQHQQQDEGLQARTVQKELQGGFNE